MSIFVEGTMFEKLIQLEERISKLSKKLEEATEEQEVELGGPGSGRRPGGGKGKAPAAPKSPRAKAAAPKNAGTKNSPEAKAAATKANLSTVNEMEKSGAGFFSRSGPDMIVNVRDPGGTGNQWANARAIQGKLKGKVGDIEPDAMSGHLVIRVKDMYDGNN
jgi:hypothetical protein